MPLHVKQATITLLEQLFLTAILAAIFAFSDYLANHNTLDWHQVLLAVIVPVSVAVLSSLKTFYQRSGDQTAVDIIDQLTPRISQIEQRLLQLPLASPQPTRAPRPLAPDTMTRDQSTSPVAPRFSLQADLGRPVSPDIPRQLPAGGAEPLFSLTSPEVEAQAARLASFPFQEKPADDSKHA